MATVVITFLLITRFYAFKMEAHSKEKRRQRVSSQREKRWSMNSQRLEEILSQLMKPINDLGHIFDTDLSELLEQYLTEAGLHALDSDDDDDVNEVVLPNFAEVALLLQQSANIYGRKVDYLYNHVLQVSDSLHNSTLEIENAHEEVAVTPSSSRRRRASATPAPGAAQFEHLALQRHARARREPAAVARPPPTLPRAYIALEPRVLPEGVEPLRDYEGEALGHISDFQVSWRLCNGYLTNGFGSGSSSSTLRPLPLMALQAAVLANAPPEPPPLALEPPEDPARCSTPIDGDMETPALQTEMPPPQTEMPPPPVRRKRRSHSSDSDVTVKLVVTEELRKLLRVQREFDGAEQWVERVVAARCRDLLALRKQLRDSGYNDNDPFRGFDFCSQDNNGFAGWGPEEAAEAAALAVEANRLRERLDESDDDGFFDLSSSDSDRSRANSTHHDTTSSTEAETEAAEWAAWRARVAAAAQRGLLAPPPDVRALAQAVLAALRQAHSPGQRAIEAGPSKGPSEDPIAGPSKGPSEDPIAGPSQGPSEDPIAGPSQGPSEDPIAGPSQGPSEGPIAGPSQGPSEGPSQGPSQGPSEAPSEAPIAGPSTSPPAPVPAAVVLATATSSSQAPVSHIFLATLFLANAGNVEVVQGQPLVLGDFSLRLLSEDQRLYCTAADLDPTFKLR